MKIRLTSPWVLAIAAWIAFIFFSSTALAGELSEQAFSLLSGELFSGIQPHTPQYGMLHLLVDKGFHVSMFCILSLLLWQLIPPSPRKALLIILTGAVVGSCSEALQMFFPTRDPALRDVMINIGGAALGVFLCLLPRLLRRDEPLAAA